MAGEFPNTQPGTDACPPSFMDELTAVLSAAPPQEAASADPVEWMVLTNGDSDPFDSVILFGFSEGRDPAFVAKVPRLPQNRRPLEVEYLSLKELWDRLGPAAQGCLPRPFALVDIGGQPALVISYIKGSSLLRASGRGFWQRQDRVRALMLEAARSLRTLNDRASAPLEAGEQLAPIFEQRLAKFRELFSLTASEDAALSDLARTIEILSARASRKVLVQGDFWHGNLIRSSRTGSLVFIDWQFARWSVDVSIDVYLFLTAAAFTAAPYGTVGERAAGASRVLSAWRADVIPAYLEAYGRPDHYALLPPRQGMLATCVEKAARPALDFGYSHPDDLMWRYLFAELVKWPEESWLPAGGGGIPA